MWAPSVMRKELGKKKEKKEKGKRRKKKNKKNLFHEWDSYLSL